jgi:hypothetical protein
MIELQDVYPTLVNHPWESTALYLAAINLVVLSTIQKKLVSHNTLQSYRADLKSEFGPVVHFLTTPVREIAYLMKK